MSSWDSVALLNTSLSELRDELEVLKWELRTGLNASVSERQLFSVT
jgi:hypothetical protein